MTLQPPKYTWTASNAKDALTVLDAASKLITAHLMTLDPDNPYPRAALCRETSLDLTLDLDLSAVVEAINKARQPDEQCQPGDSASTNN
ncbi:hypothetical protein AB0J01_41440 [Streptomyces sp. NPDC050204]|uniref:hypothetical protein n=1 Tax=Streptomyces sp. NPDC050204 TaxID=3155514 RepID=UPI00343D298D